MEYLMTFNSTHMALKAESVLKERDIPFRLITAPKQITARCALLISVSGYKRLMEASEALTETPAEAADIYIKDGDDYVKM